MKFQACIVVVLCHVICAVAIRLSLEGYNSRGSHVIHERSNSSTGKTAFLRDGGHLSYFLCLRQDTAVRVADVRYSNDGGPDLVSLMIDNTKLGSFITGNKSDWGKLWNVFHSSGPVGKVLVVKEGWHVLMLTVKATNGIEIDYIQLELSDETITHDILTCTLMCTNDLPVVPPVAYHVQENATLLQTSYPTQCAEEDNIKIPVFLKNVMEYKVTATLPHYRTFINERHPNTSGCPNLPSVYWKIPHIVIPQRLTRAFHDGVRVDFLFGYSKPYTSQVLQIAFRLKGRSKGYIDADIGSKVTIKIQPVRSKVSMQVLYEGRAKKILGLNDQVFNPGETTKVWHVPDFSWTEYEENTLFVSIAATELASFVLEFIQLERRYMRPDRPFMIYKSDDIIIEGIDVDFPWRAPETMQVRRLDNGQVFPKVDYFRISRSVPWSTGYAQIFVLYQDGNVRLLELPPSGLDWIPFGTSIIIGQSDPNDFRPAAPIKRMDLSPQHLNMTLFYSDGASAKLNLKATVSDTILKVSELFMKRDPKVYPFATFRSMHVKDGNSDSDSVLVDGKMALPVERGWKTLSGKSFMLFRRCESKHLTLSPDIRLDIEETASSIKHKTDTDRLWGEFLAWRRLMV